jgi:oxygen-independent coproporphyrinogen-3 oxidase
MEKVMHHPTPLNDPMMDLKQALQRKDEGYPVWGLFPDRIRTHHEAMRGISSQAWKGNDAVLRVDETLKHPGSSTRPRAIYIHIPFCQKICNFCAFVRKPFGEMADGYVKALLQSIHVLAKTPWALSHPFDAVFFGGGTPTSLPKEHLCELVDTIASSFRLRENCEFTLEARFLGMDQEYLDALSRTAVNRLSFGVQTFDTELRHMIGRHEGKETVAELLTYACGQSFRSISVDLLYNLPGQSVALWDADIETVHSLPITGVSTYALIPFPNSPMMHKIANGSMKPLADIDTEFTYYKIATHSLMSQNNWTRLTPFHFGKRDQETCVYNESRLGNTDILGIGCAAGGSVDGMGYMNNMNPEDFINTVHEGTNPVSFASSKSDDAAHYMPLYELVREHGIDSSFIEQSFPEAVPLIEHLMKLGLLQQTNTRLHLTANGCFWTYTITSLITRCIAQYIESTQHSQTKSYSKPAKPLLAIAN